jgi:hypothetical protein
MPCEHCDPAEHNAFDIELRELLKKHLKTGVDDIMPDEARGLLASVATRLAFHLGTVGRMMVAVEHRHGETPPDVALDGPEVLIEAFVRGIDHAEHHEFSAVG